MESQGGEAGKIEATMKCVIEVNSVTLGSTSGGNWKFS